MKKYKKYSEIFKFENVVKYRNLNSKGYISKKAFAKQICYKDYNNVIKEDAISVETFRGWIKKVDSYNPEDVYNLLCNKTKQKRILLKTKKIRKKELINDYFDEDLNIFWRSRNGIKENMPESKVENTIEKEKKRRCRYSLNFKKKWVDIFNKDVKFKKIDLVCKRFYI